MQVENPAARVSTDKDGCKWRMKQELACAMLLVDHKSKRRTSFSHNSSARVTSNILQKLHISASVFCYPPNVEHQWKTRSYISPKSGMDKGLCQSHGFSTTSYSIQRRNDGPTICSLQAHMKAKTLRTSAEGDEDCEVGVADLIAQKSRRNSDGASTRFTRQLCSCSLHRQ